MSSDSDDENEIRYGTPLEPYEEDEVPSKRKFQQPADQFAVDEHGRRRFHGAFTGGFSAGFQNSVGTADGWKPAEFKSSRGEKAQRSSQRPEDFMDEEDRSEFGIAPRHMQTHSEFSGQKRTRQRQFHDGPIPGEPVLGEVLVAVHETAAVRMLRAMGWRPGQGAGQRLSKGDKKQARERHKVYGCYMPKEMRMETDHQSDESSDSEYDFDTLYAPDDYEPYVLEKKSDRFGLGYSGLSRHSVLGNLVGEYGADAGTSRSQLLMKDKGKKVSIRGQAFGVGAFEADDEDVYATEDMSHYDFAIGGAAKQEAKKMQKKSSDVLPGFARSSNPLPSVASYPAPALPRTYTPAVAGARRSRFEPTTAPQRDQGLGRHDLTAEARGALLGETAPKTIQPDSQTNIQASIQTEDPIAKVLGRNVNFVTPELPKKLDLTHTPEKSKELDFISIKDSGKDIVKVFKPFLSNPQKQARYEKFLNNKDGFSSEGDGQMDRLSEWERSRELVEFEQAAKLYRPLTGEMGDRFTHASEPDDAVNPLTTVARSKGSYGLVTAEQVAAAERGVYGVMTRKEAAWRPEPLVCKRFNVPEIGARAEPQKEERPKVSYSIFSYLETSVHDKESFAKEQSKFSGSKSLNTTDHTPKPIVKIQAKSDLNTKELDPIPSTSVNATTGFQKRMTVADLFLKESEKDLKSKDPGVQVTDTIEKFDKMDLYKSIFLSDSEEEDEEVVQKDDGKINFDDFIVAPKNVERNTSPPKGIFANIDFDEINSWKRTAESKKPEETITKPEETNTKPDKESHSNTTNAEKAQDLDDNIYGPKIPENILKRLEGQEARPENFKPVFRSKTQKEKEEETIEVSSTSSSDSWVDAKEVKSKKHKKKKSKKHKSKHKSKKSKHKKKDR